MPYGFHNDRSKAELGAFTDFFYPVGSYYETSDTTFDPNDEWVGTWQLETEGLVHISAGTNYPVNGAPTDTQDGGNKDAIIPYHHHGFTNPTADAGGAASIGGGGHEHYYQAIMYVGGSYQGQKGTYYGHLNSTGATWGGGGHTHDIGNHTHTTSGGSVHYEGESATDKNMQPYIIVNRWHRIA